MNKNVFPKPSGSEVFLIASLLIFGSLVVFLTPINGGYDEDQHLIRVWEMSGFVFAPGRLSAAEMEFPEAFFDLSYRRQPLIEPVPADFWEKNAGLRLYDRGYHYRPLRTRSVYSPPLLLPQALVMRYLGRREDLPALTVYYAIRYAGLFSYMLLTWLAVRLMPYYKWRFLFLTLSPMAIFQASTISADAVSNGIGFLFIAACLALRERSNLGWKETGWLIALVFMLFLSKVNQIPLVLLPFALIPPKKFRSKFSYLLLIAASVILFAVEVVGWNWLASSNVSAIARNGISLSGQIEYILSNPPHFLQVIFNDLFLRGPAYLLQWIGVYGYGTGKVPGITYVFFLLGMAGTLFLKEDAQQPDRRTRLVLVSFFLAICLATVSLFYFTLTEVGEKVVYGVQGRYFVPVAPLLVLALPALSEPKRLKFTATHAATFSALAATAYVAGLFLSFHVTCGTSYYSRGLCVQPRYKNYAPLLKSTAPISDGSHLAQEIAPVCNGLTLVQVRINSSAGSGSTEFTVRDSERNVDLVKVTTPNNELPDDSWYPLNFPPDWDSAGKTYTLSIRGAGGGEGEGPMIAYSLKPEYPAGTLFEDGQPVQNDIIFQYGCITGWEKFLLTMGVK